MKHRSILFLLLLAGCNDERVPAVDYPAGGYNFSKDIRNRDFYCYPLIKKISRRDSFQKTFLDAAILKRFQEPNISLEPSDKPVIRMLYNSYRTYVITLTATEMVVKSAHTSWWPTYDYQRLTPKEQLHLSILRSGYPIDEASAPGEPLAPKPPPGPGADVERMLDSVKNNTPILLSRAYFDYLLKKAEVKTPFSYATRRIGISNEAVINFLNMLNNSDYWKLHHDLRPKPAEAVTDDVSFFLEINTGEKYNYVESTESKIDSSRFYKVCQHFLNMAQIDDSMLYLRHYRSN